MRVGFHAPLPPARTGVADYAQALLGELRKLGRVDCGASHADAHLYHLGNNRQHAAIYERALRQPGVVVLHDAVLHHFLLGHLSQQRYEDEFVFNHGEWYRDYARRLWQGRARAAADLRYFRYPMLKRVAAGARCVIVHNAGAAAAVHAAAPGQQVVEIPHLAVAPAPYHAAAVAQFRTRLGVTRRTFLFGIFGYLRESKRIFPALRAFVRLRQACPQAAILLAGQAVSAEFEAALRATLPQGALRLSHLPERTFWLAAQSVDACINLRYPPAGETSGIAIRLMSAGKPVLMTLGRETSAFAEGTCFRLDSGLAEEDMLLEAMTLLVRFPDLAQEMGRRAAAWMRLHHDPAAAARAYWDCLVRSTRP